MLRKSNVIGRGELDVFSAALYQFDGIFNAFNQ
jgi:hypothetical protein